MPPLPSLTSHYHQLLGLPPNWNVENVTLSITGKQIEIRLVYTDKQAECPECGQLCKIYDHTSEQQWRHLDTMQFETIIVARLPRCKCKEHGVKTVRVPWAARHSRFTLMFESFAIELLMHCSSIKAASSMLNLNWHAVDEIMRRAVKRGLNRRESEAIAYLGIDKKSFKAGQHYVTTLNDLDKGRVLEVVEHRTNEAAKALLESLNKKQQEQVKAVSADMWKPYANAVEELLPNADLVHDRFHISKYLSEAVDAVRRKESRELDQAGDKRLVGSKYVWLRNPENMREQQKVELSNLMACEFKTSQAWALKNMFRYFWQLGDTDGASFFFEYWSRRVDEVGLTPLIEVKELLQRHFDHILTYFKHAITNAVSEGLNSKIQIVKASARGFHRFESYRNRILFYCGKLNMAISS
ncbi:transposase, IS204/IS1001/IS1096/IS1165 family protein [Chlorobium phaeobacteroides DSM 266]|uniref:Transposase, IS204/IS1001/IS1096/IS1165 family protein n=1 Tax=Chlorobium phaeobacteroides (strain DSM 266 / SMG 266 / 2430) TaxID=290317 RepID=A1BHT6_CHLPD|nr:ISL3 family transposase [Chlorobium phaeobacteroides]ABL65963.1 transposase, IS204/IS1001/IS1096/IS1165 family protein [Chlorobium phaeobacteroides DSM 266]